MSKTTMPVKTNKCVKLLVGSLIMCLGLYPAAELTRVIWVISYAYDPSRLATWIAETVVIWLLYLAIIPAIVYLNRIRAPGNVEGLK